MSQYVESEKVELKAKYTDTICKELVAFLNANGGQIVIGVDERASRTDLSFRELKIYYAEKGFHVEDSSLEANFNLRNKDGEYNLLAELLADKNNIPFIPASNEPSAVLARAFGECREGQIPRCSAALQD